jgi:hypothetical protein
MASSDMFEKISTCICQKKIVPLPTNKATGVIEATDTAGAKKRVRSTLNKITNKLKGYI